MIIFFWSMISIKHSLELSPPGSPFLVALVDFFLNVTHKLTAISTGNLLCMKCTCTKYRVQFYYELVKWFFFLVVILFSPNLKLWLSVMNTQLQ